MNRMLLTAATAAVVTATVTRWHRRDRFPAGSERWTRTNHAGEPVTLTAGVAVAAGTTVSLAVTDPPAALATAIAAAAGVWDDLAGDGGPKGLRGHLTALRSGRVTTGAGKVALLGLAGISGCALSDRSHARPRPLWSSLAGGALVAGSANLANLLDLRPGRALKVALAHGIPMAVVGHPAAAAASGAALTVLPGDLHGETMLGDTGANAVGAAIGMAAAQALGPGARVTALAAVAGLTLLSERVSFTAVIESTPVLRELDRWGR